jgi:hypothetical protein
VRDEVEPAVPLEVETRPPLPFVLGQEREQRVLPSQRDDLADRCERHDDLARREPASVREAGIVEPLDDLDGRMRAS